VVRVAIEGGIGSGKTSTATLVAELLGWEVVLEQTATHPFLADFYADMERYKLETELGFVLLHYHQLHVLQPGSKVVSDFSQGKDLIFARMNLEAEDLDLVELLYKRLSGKIQAPELCVVLDLPVSALIDRIQKRARAYEIDMPKEYLERLLRFYETDQAALGPNVRRVALTGRESREDVARTVANIAREALHI
jgi:deoxyadenosine/deoxycytidine kinase